MISNIENIELSFLSLSDYKELKKTMVASYPTLPEMYWEESQIKKLIDIFSS